MLQIKSSSIRTATVSQIAVLLWVLTNLTSLTVYMKYQIGIRSIQNHMLAQIQKQVQQWNEYEVIMKFGSNQPPQNQYKRPIADVTLVTQCSVNNLHYIVETLSRWKGPISVAIFGPKDHFAHANFGAKSLMDCFSTADTNFHIVFPRRLRPTFSDNAVEIWAKYYKIKDRRTRCNKLLTTLQSITGSNYALGDIPYPHNTLRNVAKRGVTSTHMLLLDIDVMPPSNVRELFLKNILLASATSGRSHTGDSDKMVYITPVFEIETNAKLPSTKSELKRAIEEEQARVFHIETCPVCHKSTKNDEWLSLPEDHDQPIAFAVEWSPSWEPFYISSTSVPDYNERFKQYGYDRISQICELYVAGYKFVVLSDSYVVHRGMKRPGNFHAKKNEDNKRNLKIFNREFKQDLKIKYPESKRWCRETKKKEGRAEVSFHPRIQLKSKRGTTIQDKEL